MAAPAAGRELVSVVEEEEGWVGEEVAYRGPSCVLYVWFAGCV